MKGQAVTKAREKKDCLFSMSFILYENEWEKNEYTYSDLKTRAEQLFKSALENIECTAPNLWKVE